MGTLEDALAAFGIHDQFEDESSFVQAIGDVGFKVNVLSFEFLLQKVFVIRLGLKRNNWKTLNVMKVRNRSSKNEQIWM